MNDNRCTRCGVAGHRASQCKQPIPRAARLMVLLAGLLMVGPAPAYQVEGNVFTLTDQEMAQCRAEGGCVLYSREGLREEMADAYQQGLMRGLAAGIEKGAKACPGRSA